MVRDVSLPRSSMARLATYYLRDLVPEQYARRCELRGILPDGADGCGVHYGVGLLAVAELRRSGVTLPGMERLLAGYDRLRSEVEHARGGWHLLLTPNGAELVDADTDAAALMARRGSGSYIFPAGKWATDVLALAPDFRRGVPQSEHPSHSGACV